MAKYEVLREKYSRYEDGGIRKCTFVVDNDVEAILEVEDRWGYGYRDENDCEEWEEGFIRPNLEEAIKHLASNNGGGCDYILYIKNLDSGEIIFQDKRYMEE